MYNFYPNYQRHEVVRVSGRNGAEAFQMAPNSSILLLDETAPIVWLKTADGAGYPTLTPYAITLYEPEPEVSISDIVKRITKLEEVIHESDADSTKRTKPDKTNGKHD